MKTLEALKQAFPAPQGAYWEEVVPSIFVCSADSISLTEKICEEIVESIKVTDDGFILMWDDGVSDTLREESFDSLENVCEELKIRFSAFG